MAPSRARTLSALYLIADLGYADDQQIDLVAAVGDYLRAGGRFVSLRGGDCGDRRLIELARRIGGMVYSAGGTFLVHRRADIARLAGADGVHLSSRGLRRRDAVRLLDHSAVVGRSCHQQSEVEDARREDIGFVTLGPIFESLSKPGYGPRLDPREFEAASAVSLPVYALGGVVPGRVTDCLKLGASGVGVVGGILGADSPFEATSRYLEMLSRHREDSP